MLLHHQITTVVMALIVLYRRRHRPRYAEVARRPRLRGQPGHWLDLDKQIMFLALGPDRAGLEDRGHLVTAHQRPQHGLQTGRNLEIFNDTLTLLIHF